MGSEEKTLRRQIRNWILLFISGLAISGITAFAIETELNWITTHVSFMPAAIQTWLHKVHEAVRQTNGQFPFLAYGTDWLAFAHLTLAVLFIGPLRHPVTNIWVLEFGIVACLMVFPTALIAGYFREIPVFWRIIDCMFGVLGLIPLLICYGKVKKLEKLVAHHSHRHHKQHSSV